MDREWNPSTTNRRQTGMRGCFMTLRSRELTKIGIGYGFGPDLLVSRCPWTTPYTDAVDRAERA